MRSYERNGVHVEQCSECRGLFLDRGELEQLIAAETRWQAAPAVPPSAPQPSHHYPPQPYRRKKSFLEELFD